MRLRRPVSPAYATQREAIAYLASVCDGAIQRDGHGFSADHVELGHTLADSRWWGPLARRRVLQLMRVYRSQLQRAGYDTGCLLSGGRPPRISRRAARQVSPGWYADPARIRPRRYYNGARWTSLTSTTV